VQNLDALEPMKPKEKLSPKARLRHVRHDPLALLSAHAASQSIDHRPADAASLVGGVDGHAQDCEIAGVLASDDVSEPLHAKDRDLAEHVSVVGQFENKKEFGVRGQAFIVKI
jgi:hypothetical protein